MLRPCPVATTTSMRPCADETSSERELLEVSVRENAGVSSGSTRVVLPVYSNVSVVWCCESASLCGDLVSSTYALCWRVLQCGNTHDCRRWSSKDRVK